MSITWTGRRVGTRLAVPRLTLGALVAAAPAVSASALAGRRQAPAGR